MAKELQESLNDRVEESRRKFLKTAGKVAVYTPPAMLVVSQPSYATFQTSTSVDVKYPQEQFPKIQPVNLSPCAPPRTPRGFLARFCRFDLR